MQMGVLGVDGMAGVGAHAQRAGQEGLVGVALEAHDTGEPAQDGLEEGAGRPGAGRRADLLVVVGDEDDGVDGGLRIPLRPVPAAAPAGQGLEGDEPGVNRGEVVQAGGGQELPVPPEAGGGLGGEGEDVVGGEVGRADSGELAQVGLDGAGLAAGGGVVEARRAGRVFRTGRAGQTARTARDSRTARTTRANRTARAGRGPAAGSLDRKSVV